MLVIDGWRIDIESNRIARAGVEQRLEPRSMELLVYLAQRPGQVVSRAEIEDQVWQGRVVSYEALSGSIAKIRKAFGDTGRRHRIIETIPKSGYRLIASALASDPAPDLMPEVADSAPAVNKNPKRIPAVAMLLAIVVGIAWWQPWIEPDTPSIAVLPFTNMSGDPEQAYFADGLTDDLITDLSKISGLFVIARNSTFVFKNKPVSIRQVADELGVSHVLEGSVQRSGNQVRINAQLIDTDSEGHLWAQRYDGKLDDVFDMRDKIVRQITRELSVELVDQELASLKRVETNSPEAYDLLLRGQDYYRIYTPDSLVKAIPYLENAIELDPDFARAHAQLAAVYWGICNNAWAESAGMSYQRCNTKTSRHLAAAMQNPTPLAHRIAARQHEYHQRWEEALVEARRAIDLDPSDPNGYEAMSALQVNLGRAEEGLENIEKAIRLDPLSDYLWRLGYAQFHLERYADAAATMNRATRRNPDYDWNFLLLAAAYGHLGRDEKAREAITKFNKIRLERGGGKPPFTLADLQYWSIKDEAGLRRLRNGMRKAGVPAK